MAGASLLALLDDVTSMLDDVALMTKVAAKKTVGVLGDDLALNAEQVSGSEPKRELPVVISVAKGSLVNKAILIPVALGISAFAPWLITPLLMLGGAYLSFEGMEKVAEWLRGKRQATTDRDDLAETPIPMTPEQEKKKVRGAIRTDFILSTEIIVIALGTLPQDQPLWERALVLCTIGLAITIGVYGVVAAIVKLDDAGLWLIRKSHGQGPGAKTGELMVDAMPYLMRFLTVAGTVAMFLVGGGIIAHGVPGLEVRIESVGGLFLPGLWAAFLHIGVGVGTGLSIMALAGLAKRVSVRQR